MRQWLIDENISLYDRILQAVQSRGQMTKEEEYHVMAGLCGVVSRRHRQEVTGDLVEQRGVEKNGQSGNVIAFPTATL